MASKTLSPARDVAWIEARGVVSLVKVLVIEALYRRVCAPLVMVVVTVDATVLPLNVRVRSNEKPSSPVRETCLGDGGPSDKNHCMTRLGIGASAMVLRFSDVGGRRSDEIRDGIVRELADEGESLGNENASDGSSDV